MRAFDIGGARGSKLLRTTALPQFTIGILSLHRLYCSLHRVTHLVRVPTMDRNLRMTGPTLQVLEVLLHGFGTDLSGADIAKETKLLSGTLYPILHRLERLGWVNAEFENVDPSEVGRPRRRYYRLKALAQPIAREALVRRGYLKPNSLI